MKITYLAYTKQPDKSTRLSVVSYDEWKQVVQKNRMLPAVSVGSSQPHFVGSIEPIIVGNVRANGLK